MSRGKIRKKSGRTPYWRRWLFILWFVLSYGWMISTARHMELRNAVNIYSAYNRYADRIADRRATDYEKHLYMSYGPRLDSANKAFASFFLVGIGLPCLILSGGTWLLRTKR